MQKELLHLGLIPDGNGRWAAKRHQPREYGHIIGYQVILKILKHCQKLNIKYITLFTLSYDNITKRNELEVANICSLIKQFAERDIDELNRLNCRFIPIGDYRSLLTEEASKALELMETKTKKNTGMLVRFAVGYLGTRDIAHSVQKLYHALNDKLPNTVEEIIDGIHKFSDLGDAPPIDLCIRLGGEERISNFCLWELAYAEFEFLDALWPDFSEEMLDKCVADYYKRDRRFGTETKSTLSKK